MFTEASLDPERCATKADHNARRSWNTMHIRHIGLFEDVKTLHINPIREEAMEKGAMEEDTGHTYHYTRQTELPTGSSGILPPTRGTTTKNGSRSSDNNRDTIAHGRHSPHIRHVIPTNSSLRGTRWNVNANTTDQKNRFTPLIELGSASGGKESEALSSGILRKG